MDATSVKKILALEEENKILKLKILTLTNELEEKQRPVQVGKGGTAKRRLSVENVNPRERPKKRRKVEEGLDPPCAVENPNPFEIKKIMGLILTNLGKRDLLNARMVSRAWNDESLKVLRTSEFTQTLTECTLEDYILFTKSTERRRSIIPFHLNFEINLSNGVLGLKTLTSHVDSLCQIFGPQCVSRLTLATNAISEENTTKKSCQIEFLPLISQGLKTMDFARFDFKFNIEQNQNQMIIFPNLIKLMCNTRECESGRMSVYDSIIENSPNLEDLTLTHSSNLVSWPLKFEQLKSLSLDRMFKPQNILDKILASPGPPVLQKLGINFRDDASWIPKEKIVVYNILESVSPTLKSLRFWGHMGTRTSGIPGLMRFPKLSHLEHLGLEYNICHKYWLNPEDINLNEETFPCLKSIELPIGLIWTHSSVKCQEDGEIYSYEVDDEYEDSNDGDEDDDDVRIEFPNLIKLILRVSETARPEYLVRTLKHLQRMFPIPSKLSLVNDGGNDRVKYLLDRLMESDWSKNIQEFEMIGFKQDYLGQVLKRLDFSPRVVLEKCDWNLEESLIKVMNDAFQDFMKRMKMESEETGVSPDRIIITRTKDCAIKMINVTKIKLEFIGDNDPDTQNTSTASIPYLNGFGTHFPQLRMIEISELLVHPKSKNTVGEDIILEFKSKFPGVVLNLTRSVSCMRAVQHIDPKTLINLARAHIPTFSVNRVVAPRLPYARFTSEGKLEPEPILLKFNDLSFLTGRKGKN